jgi:purine/pyrimidine-nucleoside phosphorylase
MNKMSQFTNVTINSKANIYFAGKVTSRTIELQDGTRKTLGIMLPGDYEFSTSQKEEMDIQTGSLEYKLEGQEWKSIENNGVFFVPANQTFLLKVHSVVDYCCSYLAE